MAAGGEEGRKEGKLGAAAAAVADIKRNDNDYGCSYPAAGGRRQRQRRPFLTITSLRIIMRNNISPLLL